MSNCYSVHANSSVYSWPHRVSGFPPAKMWRDDVRHVDVVDATEEGCSNDHQYKHESEKDQKNKTLSLARSWPLNSPTGNGQHSDMQM